MKCSLRLAQSRTQGNSFKWPPVHDQTRQCQSTLTTKLFLGGPSHCPVIAPQTIWSLMAANSLSLSRPLLMVNMVSMTGSRVTYEKNLWAYLRVQRVSRLG